RGSPTIARATRRRSPHRPSIWWVRVATSMHASTSVLLSVGAAVVVIGTPLSPTVLRVRGLRPRCSGGGPVLRDQAAGPDPQPAGDLRRDVRGVGRSGLVAAGEPPFAGSRDEADGARCPGVD